MPFDFDFTVEDLKRTLPGIRDADGWFAACNKLLPVYNITTKKRVAMFIAQTGHESGNWNVLEENLYYKAESLMRVFPKYYPTTSLANAHAKQPAKIANHVYCNRMGNGDEASGDGYKFRGRGLIQITGRSNYEACSQALYGDLRLLDDPDLLKTEEGALGSACWFWNSRKLNADSDRSDVLGVTKKINGGTNGLEDRTLRYNTAMKMI